MSEGDFSTVKIFHDGTIGGLFLYDANNKPMGGIASIKLIFDSMEQKPLLVIEVPVKDINGNIIFKEGKVSVKEIKVPAAKVLIFDSRMSEFEVTGFLNMFSEYRRIATPETEFSDINNVIEKTSWKR